MKALIAVLILCAGFGAASARAAQKEKFVAQREKLGAGFILGVPFGASAKYWLDERCAVQGALGFSDGDLTVSADVLENFNDVLPRKREGRLPLYAGVGLKLKAEKDPFVGMRFVGGVSFFHAQRPFEFFAEVAPVLRLAPSEGAAFDGAVGIRRYF